MAKEAKHFNENLYKGWSVPAAFYTIRYVNDLYNDKEDETRGLVGEESNRAAIMELVQIVNLENLFDLKGGNILVVTNQRNTEVGEHSFALHPSSCVLAAGTVCKDPENRPFNKE